MPTARIGLGSNVGDAQANVRAAIARLAKLGSVSATSSLYRSKAWGKTAQADFINAAVRLQTELTPRELLGRLQSLERSLGRVPTDRWGPRVIDLDILAYDDAKIDEPDLKIPHPHLYERAFVLAPLSEIDPTYLDAYNHLSKEQRAEVIPL